MDAEARCNCGHPYHRHVPTFGVGVVQLACLRCTCESFTSAPDAPTEVAATEPRANEEAGSVGATPLLVDDHTGDVYWPTGPSVPPSLRRAWLSYVCERCEGMAWESSPVCHGRPMTPVRLEMHSREPL